MNEFMLKRFQAELENALENIEIVDNIVVSSLDGIAITHASRSDQNIDSIAARSASFLSLGDIWQDTSGNLSCDNVIMESKTGTVVVIHMGLKLLLCMTTTSDATTGIILHHAKACGEQLMSIVESAATSGENSPNISSDMPRVQPRNLPNIANG